MKTLNSLTFQLTASISLLLTCVLTVRANLSPVELTTDSYNQDLVVEQSAMQEPTGPPPLTTATTDAGTANGGDAFYEQGFDANYPDSGLPIHGSTVTSISQSDHSYTFAPSYAAANDAMLIDSVKTNGTFTLAAPAAYSALSFAACSGGGSTAVNVVVHHLDGTTDTGSLPVQDWFSGANDHQILTANGRVNVQSLTFDNENSGQPNVYAYDITLTNTASVVTSIDLSFNGGGHGTIFAVSGSTGSDFTPIAVSGYNEDMIVETNTYTGPVLVPLNATTADMGSGTNLTSVTWYEQGYNMAAPGTGLPVPGTTITDLTQPGTTYTFPSSYTANNAAFVDLDIGDTITLATPTICSNLSFLASGGNGGATLNYTIHFQDTTTQSGTFFVPDWYDGATLPPAFIANGYVSVTNGSFGVFNGIPMLHSVPLVVSNTASPVMSIQLSQASPGTNTQTAIFAVSSGTSSGTVPIIGGQPLSTNLYAGSNAQFTVFLSFGTSPLHFQWRKILNGTNFIALNDSGNITGATSNTLSISNATFGNAGRYVCVITNDVGSVTSAVATLNVLSTLPDVLDLGDTISLYQGHQAEVVDNAIDHTTYKYLNFGTSPTSPPFIGPVGFTDTPQTGSTLVTAMRVYTASDSTERDPADFTLEGSNDGTNFTIIATGPLSLPDGRNPADGSLIDPLTMYNQEVDFANQATYTTYRWTCTHVKNDALANSMQIAEVELLGVATTPTAVLTIIPNSNGTLTISTTLAGELQSTTALEGASTVWQDEGPISSSVTVSPSGGARFYRVLVQ